MINFHKQSGIPRKVPAGEEHVWFSYPNGLYVSDVKGSPRRISTGFSVGTAIPVGKPSEPGLLFYNSSNKKNYISDIDRWHEIGTATIPGTGGGGGLAGNIMLEDTANNFTSVDVEGALSEVAEKFPWYFGSAKLLDYTGNVQALTQSSEKYVTAAALNKPENKTGWAVQRLASNGKTYGNYTAEDGAFYSRVGNNFYKMAKSTEVASLGASLTSGYKKYTDDRLTSEMRKFVLVAGPGIKSTGSITSGGRQTLQLDPALLAKINKVEGPYLSKNGDISNGNIGINTQNSIDAMLSLRYRDGSDGARLYMNRNTNNIGIWSTRLDNSVFRHNLVTGETGIRALKDADLWMYATLGKIKMQSKERIDIKSTAGNTVTDMYSRQGMLRLGVSVNNGFIEAFKGPSDKVVTSIRIGGSVVGDSPQVTLAAGMTYAKHSLVSGQTMHVGMDPNTQYGNTNLSRRTNSLLVLYPNYINRERNAVRNYARFAYNQARNVVELRSFRKNTGRSSYVDRENIISFEAHRFINTSTEKAKKDIKPLTESVLDEVLSVPTFLYKFKNDSQNVEHAGFIIERGVPKIAVEPDGSAIDSYAMTAYLWKAFQEYVEKTDARIKELEKRA